MKQSIYFKLILVTIVTILYNNNYLGKEFEMDFLSVENLTKMYLYIGIIATAIYFIKLVIFSMAGADTDVPEGHIDVDGTDSDVAFSFLSIQSILAFFMGFGWSGLAMMKSQYADKMLLVAVVSAVGGLIFMGLSAYITYLLRKLNDREVFDMQKVVGTVGKAYSTIKPHSVGRIEIEINSKLSVVEAQNNTDVEIPSFKPVRVIKFENNILYIEQEQE